MNLLIHILLTTNADISEGKFLEVQLLGQKEGAFSGLTAIAEFPYMERTLPLAPSGGPLYP